MTKKSEAASTEVAEVQIDQDRVDEAIWRGAGIKSVRTLAAETGLKPEEVLRRKNELLDEVDPLTTQQTRQRLIIDLQRIARKTQEDYENSPWETKAGLLNNAISAMKLIFGEMNRLEKADNSRVDALNRKRVESLVRIVRTAIDQGVPDIASRYGIPEEDLYEVFNLRLEEAARKEDEINRLF